MRHVLLSAAVITPLALDTFVLAAALGIAGVTGRDRIRVTIVFTSFEAVMPIIGILVGRVLGSLLGGWAEYGGIAILAIAGIVMLRPGRDDDDGDRRLGLLASARGLTVLYLGLSISIDELTIGLSAGLIGLPVSATIVWIAVQAFAATQLGLRFGSHLGEALRERAEWLAGVMLLLLAVVLLALKLHPD